MPQQMFDQEEGGFTFTDDDFERRYYSPEAEVPSAPGSGNPSRPVDQEAKTGAVGQAAAAIDSCAPSSAAAWPRPRGRVKSLSCVSGP